MKTSPSFTFSPREKAGMRRKGACNEMGVNFILLPDLKRN
jgi:hypothetical protein